MNIKYFALVSLIVGASFAAPLTAGADTVCDPSTVGQPCTVTNGISGKCNATGACVPNNTVTTPGNTTTQTVTTPANVPKTVTLINPLGSGATLNSFVTSILQFVVRIGSIVVIFMLVYVGFLFVKAQGNSEEISKARNALLWTIVGALILLGAQAIAIGIQATVQAISTGN